MKPLLILLGAFVLGVLYDRWMYKRAVKQGKKYYCSPITLRKYQIK